jgi:hypothetical protein
MGSYRAIKRLLLIEGGRARIISGLNRSARQFSPVAAVRVVTCRTHDRSYSNREVEAVCPKSNGNPPRPTFWYVLEPYWVVMLFS